jgi:hypothetical protein
MTKKKYRFFYHYFKAKKCMSVHFRGKCYTTQNVECLVPCESKWNKTAPNLVMRGFCTEISHNESVTVIQ